MLFNESARLVPTGYARDGVVRLSGGGGVPIDDVKPSRRLLAYWRSWSVMRTMMWRRWRHERWAEIVLKEAGAVKGLSRDEFMAV